MTEQQPFEVLERHDAVELRRYPEHLIAEVEVGGSFDSAGNRAFRSLASYIGGRNTTRRTIAMTAPVVQEEQSTAGTSIAMTSPVVQEPGAEPGRHRVAFVMPSEFTADTLPVPQDARVHTRTVPAHLAAAVRYSGRWSQSSFQRHRDDLLAALPAAGLSASGPVRWARYNPPWTPWFLRHNEVIVPVERSVTVEEPR